uniref:Alternative protein KHDRBS2 n=1 Tax=Homo sapiens TaxID=9606 RepID=L8ECN3_HUMAN|nr:alternative protein KHDRBS2 [Homo sapiens]
MKLMKNMVMMMATGVNMMTRPMRLMITAMRPKHKVCLNTMTTVME